VERRGMPPVSASGSAGEWSDITWPVGSRNGNISSMGDYIPLPLVFSMETARRRAHQAA